MVYVGCVDQGEILFIGDGKDDLFIGVLKEIVVVVIVKFWYDDMVVVYQLYVFVVVEMCDIVDYVLYSGVVCIDQCVGQMQLGVLWFLCCYLLQIIYVLCFGYVGLCQDLCVVLFGIVGVQYYQLCVLYLVIGIFSGQ